MERLADLDELTLRCRTEQSKEYIAEAVACYRAGAYRATIVVTWIAVVFDLIDKFRELSIGGEAAAKQLLDVFENYQSQIDKGDPSAPKQALEFERNILVKARDELSLLDAMQYADLDRLRVDRHRCAHPSFNRAEEIFRPSAELARLHLRSAILHVLHQPPVQGRAALAKLRALVGSEYFPTDAARARVQLANGPLARPSPRLVRDLVDDLVYGFVSSDHDLFGAQGAISALHAALDLHRGVVEERLTNRLPRLVLAAKDEDMPAVVRLLSDFAPAASYLDVAATAKVQSFIEVTAFADLAPHIVGLFQTEGWRAEIEARLSSMTTPQLETLIDEHDAGVIVVPAAIAKYAAATSFATARGRANRLIVPLIEHFTEQDLEALLQGAAGNNQCYDENSFDRLIGKLRDAEIVSSQKFTALKRKVGLR